MLTAYYLAPLILHKRKHVAERNYRIEEQSFTSAGNLVKPLSLMWMWEDAGVTEGMFTDKDSCKLYVIKALTGNQTQPSCCEVSLLTSTILVKEIHLIKQNESLVSCCWTWPKPLSFPWVDYTLVLHLNGRTLTQVYFLSVTEAHNSIYISILALKLRCITHSNNWTVALLDCLFRNNFIHM